LDRIPSTRHYQSRMQKRIKRNKLAKDTIWCRWVRRAHLEMVEA
jgi:hypothetical protein